MIEIKYGDCCKQADLTGRSVAQVRQYYEEELEIPKQAEARLNNRQVDWEQEPRMRLLDGDILSFKVRRISQAAVLVGALLMALLISGGTFAYTYTTATVIITGIGPSDFAVVEVVGTPVTFPTDVFGHYRGDVPTGKIFKITPHDCYAGYLKVEVYLLNCDELTLAYKHLNIKLQLIDCNTPPNIICGSLTCPGSHEFQTITLDNGGVVFEVDPAVWTPPFYIRLIGGGYRTHGRSPLEWGAGYDVSPELYCDVRQM